MFSNVCEFSLCISASNGRMNKPHFPVILCLHYDMLQKDFGKTKYKGKKEIRSYLISEITNVTCLNQTTSVLYDTASTSYYCLVFLLEGTKILS